MASSLSIERYCPNCKVPRTLRLCRRQMVSGLVHYCWWCGYCQRVYRELGRTWQPKVVILKEHPGINLEMLPLIPADCKILCAVCGEQGVEHHHWAPQEFFADADLWPMEWLCKKHHDLWHEIMKAQVRITV